MFPHKPFLLNYHQFSQEGGGEGGAPLAETPKAESPIVKLSFVALIITLMNVVLEFALMILFILWNGASRVRFVKFDIEVSSLIWT